MNCSKSFCQKWHISKLMFVIRMWLLELFKQLHSMCISEDINYNQIAQARVKLYYLICFAFTFSFRIQCTPFNLEITGYSKPTESVDIFDFLSDCQSLLTTIISVSLLTVTTFVNLLTFFFISVSMLAVLTTSDFFFRKIIWQKIPFPNNLEKTIH